MELVGHSSGAALLAAADAIEQAHHPFHEGQVSPPRIAVECPLHPGLSAEIEVEIATGPPCCCTQQLGVEVVRSDLERLDVVAA